MPKRIQRKRVKGWRMPEGAVYVGRPTKWGNRYRLDDYGEKALDNYREDLVAAIDGGHLDLNELRGKDLACWCRVGAPCHADILLELANR